MGSLRSTTAKGMKWTAASAAFMAITAPLFQIVKARFLTPEEFAYLAILYIFIGFMKQLEGAGLTKGVIQKDVVEIEEASSLFILNVAISILIAGLMYLSAEQVAVFFDLPKLINYLRILSLVVFLHGPSRFVRSFLEKFFLFKEIAITEITRQTILVLITIYLLILDWGVLGFVYGQTMAVLISSLMFVYFGIKNKITQLKLYFSFDKLHYYIMFGAFVSGRGVVNYFAKRLDEVAIGYFLDPEALGIYYFGKSILERLRQLSERSYGKILFPLFSKFKNEKERLTGVYYKITRYVAMFTLPMFLGISLTAHLFVPLIFGSQWQESIFVIQVFAVVFIFKMLTDGLAGNLLYSINKPNMALYIDLITDFTYLTGLLLFASMGMELILIMYSSYIIIKAFVMQFVVHKNLTHSMIDYLLLLRVTLLFSVVMIAVILAFQLYYYETLNDIFLLIGSISLGVIVYCSLTWFFDKQKLLEIKELLRS